MINIEIISSRYWQIMIEKEVKNFENIEYKQRKREEKFFLNSGYK